MRTRTSVEIDDWLLRQAMRTSKGQTERDVVEAGLRLLVHVHGQTRVRRLRGKVRWEGNLDESR